MRSIQIEKEKSEAIRREAVFCLTGLAGQAWFNVCPPGDTEGALPGDESPDCISSLLMHIFPLYISEIGMLLTTYGYV